MKKTSEFDAGKLPLVDFGLYDRLVENAVYPVELPMFYTSLGDVWDIPYVLQVGKEGDAGLDLPAGVNIRLKPQDVTLIRTGICVQFPRGVWGKIEGRSSLTAKGVFSVGGVIDNGYRGELVVGLFAARPHIVQKGDRIAQLCLHKLITPVLQYTTELDKSTERGTDGFGSTGQ